MDDKLLEIRKVTKRFGGVTALDGVDISVRAGEIHSIIGENGAGKSTLLRILSGTLGCDAGSVVLRGRDITHADPKALYREGISVAFQETSLFDNLTVAENLFLGTVHDHRGWRIDWKEIETRTLETLERFGIRGIRPGDTLGTLSAEERYVVEILKAVKGNPVLLCLDEPTSALTINSIEKLFSLLEELKGKGTTIIYVSHHLDEILRLSDRITVLRDGKTVDTVDGPGATKAMLHDLMVGRKMSAVRENRSLSSSADDVVLRCENISDGGAVRDVSLEVRCGEILGITGLVGSGRSEWAWLIYGMSDLAAGRVVYRGQEVKKPDTGKAIASGIMYLPEERRQMGVFLDQDLVINTTVSRIDKACRGPLIDFRQERKAAEAMMNRVGVKYDVPTQTALSLSGGNQQKLLLGKCLFADPELLILDEPTRGIDVGSKEDIYTFIRRLSEEGLTVVVISSEVEEICLLCDRVLVMGDGRIIGEFVGDDINEHDLTACYLGTHE